MKKVFALVLALVLVLCAIPALAEGELYLGLGICTSISSSKDATADADGTAQVDSNIVAVVVDANGVIQACSIDAGYTKVNFSAAGVVTSDVTAEVRSKMELGDDYGMLKASPIGLEIDDQLIGLSNWLVGKTVDDLKAAYEGKDETLLAVCTIHLDGYITALEKAVANALAE